MIEDLREVEYAKFWDIRLPPFPCLHAHPCSTRTPRTSHWEIFFTMLKCLVSKYVLVTSIDWSPHTMCLRLIVPSILANMICFGHSIFWPSEKRWGTRLSFSLDSSATVALISVIAACSHALRKPCILWSKWLVSLEGNSKFRAAVCGNWNVRSFLNSYKSHCAGVILKNVSTHTTSKSLVSRSLECKDNDDSTWHLYINWQITKHFHTVTHLSFLPCPWEVGRCQAMVWLRMVCSL